jgi:hypothetical protein
MNKSAKVFVFIIVPLILIVFVIYFFFVESSLCDQVKLVYHKEINAEIIRIGKENSGGRPVGYIVVDGGNLGEHKFTWLQGFSVYDSLKIGDSLFKEKDDDFFVFRRNGESIGQIDWDCNPPE